MNFGRSHRHALRSNGLSTSLMGQVMESRRAQYFGASSVLIPAVSKAVYVVHMSRYGFVLVEAQGGPRGNGGVDLRQRYVGVIRELGRCEVAVLVYTDDAMVSSAMRPMAPDHGPAVSSEVTMPSEQQPGIGYHRSRA